MSAATNDPRKSGAKLAIELWFLTGRFVATSFNDRTRTEWPPHFSRIFSALVREWAENGMDEREETCLRWLEELGPPKITASSASQRTAKSHYVPVNDIPLNRESAQKLSFFPDHRPRQERHFPSCTPDMARVVYQWESSDNEHFDSLRDLLERVTRIGHSSSLTNCRLIDDPPEPNLIPALDGDFALRTVSNGQLDALTSLYRRHEELRPRSLPYELTNYADSSESLPDSVVSSRSPYSWVVYALNSKSRFLPSVVAVQIASLFRRALFRYTEDPIPEVLSGHVEDGSPTRHGHLGVVPLLNVGNQHADGRILGLALAWPQSIVEHDKMKLYRAINDWEANSEDSTVDLYLDSSRSIRLNRVIDQSELVNLRESTWSRAANRWVSATPVALPRHPGKLGRGNPETRRRAWRTAEKTIELCCDHAGLPLPKRVEVSLKPYLNGASSVKDFPPFAQFDARSKSHVSRCLLHVSLEFDTPVRGPIVLGAGQFLGLGLMRPLRDPSENRAQIT